MFKSNWPQHTAHKRYFSDFDQHDLDLCRLKMNTSNGRALRQDYFKLEQFQSSAALHKTCVNTDVPDPTFNLVIKHPFPHPKTKVYSGGATACFFFTLTAICLIKLQKNIPFRLPGTNIPLFGTQLLV